MTATQADSRPSAEHPGFLDAVRGQPVAVWATAFAAVIAFMGIGLVDPILPEIAKQLDAGADKVTLLFAVYMGVQVLAMLITGFCSYRFGPKRTLIAGLVFIVVAAGVSATANGIGELIALRVAWGLGNALFMATALAFIIGSARGGQHGAILLYEAALGLGLAVGPLIGAILGEWTWRAPFGGTAILMAIGAILCATKLTKDGPSSERPKVGITDPLRALKNRKLLVTGIGSAFYTAGFFTVIAWAPIVLDMRPIYLGLVFVGWGLCVALSGVTLAPKVVEALGEKLGVIAAVGVFAVVMIAAAIGTAGDNKTLVMAAIIFSGIPSGVLNTALTGMAMAAGSGPRSVSSAGYNFLRWMGAAVSALLVAHLAEWFGSNAAPYWFAAGYCAVAVLAISMVGGAPKPAPTAETERRLGEAALVGAEEL
ncbi:putative MFS family arabinose efflux permease [Williamsia limnetica]|uniref:Putative MFS family arabinose efflux permease n=1 Tax=Williamsia limnetica TaxID=882452 RepID=A0A318RIZ8_WILLI|nr:MFS transporter [Williamsia limnetica]PYE14996.1 putative MFS family arabinose efflux permease [Williamsia limnetica]